jgi:hypothetical protein
MPRLPARAAGGTQLGPAAITAHWSLADGATLSLGANLAAKPCSAPPLAHGRRLLSTAEPQGNQWPPWYVEWRLD